MHIPKGGEPNTTDNLEWWHSYPFLQNEVNFST